MRCEVQESSAMRCAARRLVQAKSSNRQPKSQVGCADSAGAARNNDSSATSWAMNSARLAPGDDVK